MNAIQLLLLSVSIFVLGSILSLILSGSKQAARIASGWLGAIASIIGLISAIQALVSVPTPLYLAGQLPFGNFAVQMDGLSALMVGIISVVSLAACIYSISYLAHYADRNLGLLGFFTNLFIALMLLVVTVANAFYFLIFWEMMTLASYFLVIFESQKKESVQAGYLYMLVAHAGTALIMLAFFIFYSSTGSFDFSAWLYRIWRQGRCGSLAYLAAARAPCRSLPCFGLAIWCHDQDRYIWHPARLCGFPRTLGLVVGGRSALVW